MKLATKYRHLTSCCHVTATDHPTIPTNQMAKLLLYLAQHEPSILRFKEARDQGAKFRASARAGGLAGRRWARPEGPPAPGGQKFTRPAVQEENR